jgi:RNA polymerase sigma factor (sigma-70 family)
MPGALFSDFLRHLRRTAGIAEAAGLEDSQLLQRFLTSRDEAAFTLLVRRHGAMVLGVCQRLLSNSHDCEDAFQATFLVLLRSASSIRKHESLANWLYGVAHRTALKARTRSKRWHAHQRQVIVRPVADCDYDASQRELRSVLDEELARLPAKYRAPVVLCYLEGKTFTEAAAQLGCPAGTVSGRLARAREILRKRLTRRDITPAAGWEVVMLQPAAPTLVPASLMSSTLKSAVSLAAGSVAGASAIPGPVAALTEGVIKAMFLTKIKILAAVVGIGVIATGGVLVSAAMPTQTAVGHTAQVRAPIEGEHNPNVAQGVPRQPPVLDAEGRVRERAAEELVNGADPNIPPFPGLSAERAKFLLEKSDQPPNLKPILSRLFNAANVEADARWQQYNAGQGTLDIVLGSSRRLLEAEQLLNKEKANQLAALEHHLKRMKEAEAINQTRFDAGRIPIQDLAQSRYYRIQAELWLEQAKAK